MNPSSAAGTVLETIGLVQIQRQECKHTARGARGTTKSFHVAQKPPQQPAARNAKPKKAAPTNHKRQVIIVGNQYINRAPVCFGDGARVWLPMITGNILVPRISPPNVRPAKQSTTEAGILRSAHEGLQTVERVSVPEPRTQSHT